MHVCEEEKSRQGERERITGEKRSQERKDHRRERITGEKGSQERTERRHRTCTPHLSDSPGSLCVHGRVGSPCEGVLAR